MLYHRHSLNSVNGPVQLHLLNPQAAYFREADVVLAADCAAYAYGDFHQRFLTGKTLAIACPKLDTGKESYDRETHNHDRCLANTFVDSSHHGSSLLWRLVAIGSYGCGKIRQKNTHQAGYSGYTG